MNQQLFEKSKLGNGPKRMLTLDGGGIRGILTLGILKKIEELARQQTNNKDLLLSEYYDLISGTSTGAIIACGLAIGKTVQQLTDLYLGLGKEIFGEGRKKKWLKRSWTTVRSLFSENYSSANLEKYLRDTFGEISLGDDNHIKCGLAINSKRADTYSLWTVANHPAGKYFQANAHLKLWELCRASSAAPYYFKPKKLVLKTRQGESFQATFIDGGVSLANNPAWQTFLVATHPSFGFTWNFGKDNLLITSLGTGNGQTKENADKLENLKTIMWAPKLSDLFMVDALEMNQIMLEIFGQSAVSNFTVDSQFEDLSKFPLLEKEKKLFTFQRHNVKLIKNELEFFSTTLDDEKIESLKKMDYHENMQLLLQIGEEYGQKFVTDIL